jgi:hypothetical protein
MPLSQPPAAAPGQFVAPPQGGQDYSAPGGLPQYGPPYSQQQPFAQQPQQNPAGYGIVPYKNGQALGAYYSGCFSFILPILGPVAVVLGIIALQRACREPLVKGQAHAVIGIIAGLFACLLWVLLIISWSSY